ncbi:MAG: hypothetical protein QXS98_07250 [Candidatus Nitrosocaldus sp.]
MKYELKGCKLRRRYDVEDGEMVMMMINIIIGGTVIALVLALPTVAILLTIYYISNDAMLAVLASLAVHYAILLLLVEWISIKIYYMLDEGGEMDDYDDEDEDEEEEKEKGIDDESTSVERVKV